MTSKNQLLTPSDAALVLVDVQAGLAFGVESMERQVLLNNIVALARMATVFNLPTIVSTSATKVYSGPLIGAVHAVLPNATIIERRNMNLWEDGPAKAAVISADRRRLIFCGMLTEACITFPVLSALDEGFEVYVAGDACGGLTSRSHEFALRRMENAGAHMTSWVQVLLEMQRDWTRHETYEAARAIVVENGGGYGIGLDYARQMIHPG
jgi:nicotinamidase-related amidase